LSHLTSQDSRANVLAWYVATATLGSSLGTELAGRLVEYLQQRDGWSVKDAYHSLFWLYAAIGLANLVLVSAMSVRAEDDVHSKPVNTAEEVDILLDDMDDENEAPTVLKQTTPTPPRKGGLFAQISPETRRITYKLGGIFALDSVSRCLRNFSMHTYFSSTVGWRNDQLESDQLLHRNKVRLAKINPWRYHFRCLPVIGFLRSASWATR
jgi:hypothetical protein